jgi:hypothetical protein
MCTTCNRKSRISGGNFRSKGKDGLVNSLGRGVAAFSGFALGEATTNKIFKTQKAKNQGLIGAGKVLASHVVAPMLLPDKIMANEMVQSGLDGFGVSGVKDILLSNAASFATQIGISGPVDYTHYGRQTRIPASNTASVPASADLG